MGGQGRRDERAHMFKITFSTEIQIYRVVFKREVGQKWGRGGSVCRKHRWETWNVTARIKKVNGLFDVKSELGTLESGSGRSRRDAGRAPAPHRTAQPGRPSPAQMAQPKTQRR